MLQRFLFIVALPIVSVCLFAQSVPLQITNAGLPQGQQGNIYGEAFNATGGTPPYSWSISAGTVPPGIAMNGNGNFVGVPSTAGTFNFTVMVKDAGSNMATGNYSLTLAAATGYDGPAQLPIATVASSLADTPAPGSVISVNAGADLQAALNSAQCGNTIQLQAGATFTGTFEFPALNCDSSHWIIVRTSSPDSALPPEGQRLTPCYAGVASLLGRPQYPCNNPQNVLAKLVAASLAGPVVFQTGANHYRLMGLELTRPPGTKGGPVLMLVKDFGTASYIVLDRSWLHGTTVDETKGGFNLSGTNNVAVVDSYFSDFHCTAITGTCTEAHAVAGGNEDYQDGPFLIQNNFLESAGQQVLFGGAAATTTPTDITVRLNDFFKPWQWMKGNSPFQGGVGGNPFIVRPALEFRNAVRVLAEDNLIQDVWGGLDESGIAVLFDPVNQPVKSGKNVCPICQVTDLTFRYNHIIHAGGGMSMVTAIQALHGTAGAPAKAATRFSVHDIVIDDISRKYIGGGDLFKVANSWPANPLHTVTINHITGFPDPKGGILTVWNQISNPEMYAFVITNSIVTTGKYPVWNGAFGDMSCAHGDIPLTTLTNCFATYTFDNNVLIASPPHFSPSTWPTGNLFAPNPNGVGFAQYDNGNNGNYQLLPGSAYQNAGSDGFDLGANIVGLNFALAGVE